MVIPRASTFEARFDDASLVGADWLIDRDSPPTTALPMASLLPVSHMQMVLTLRPVGQRLKRQLQRFTAERARQHRVPRGSRRTDRPTSQIVITALLVLCLVVAFFGIVNTMVLAVLERTREIGLLRAVGMTRRQLQSSVRWEAAIISLLAPCSVSCWACSSGGPQLLRFLTHSSANLESHGDSSLSTWWWGAYLG